MAQADLEDMAEQREAAFDTAANAAFSQALRLTKPSLYTGITSAPVAQSG